jgi:predicted DNA-binding transcriptional regulator YafY
VTALDKVILALPKSRRAEVERSQIYVPKVGRHREVDPMREALNAAINDHAVLRLTYADDSNRQTRRNVRPLALYFWGQVWTLAAWCELRVDFRSFRLDRIRACERTGASFSGEPGKTVADFLRSAGVRPGNQKSV